MKKVGLEHRNRGETVEPSEHIKDQDRRFEQFYESNLYLDNVRTEHYTSVFRCEASNRYGTDYHEIEVNNIYLFSNLPRGRDRGGEKDSKAIGSRVIGHCSRGKAKRETPTITYRLSN